MAVKTFTARQKGLYLSDNFTVGDFWSNPRYESIKLDVTLALVWEKFYREFGVKPRLRNAYNGQKGEDYKAVESAGYRDPKADWKGSKTSQHCYGRGVDMELPGVAAYRLAQFAETLSEIGGIGFYYIPAAEEWNKQEHIHIDTRLRLGVARWGHNGKTSGVNIPTFGGVYKALRRGRQGWAVWFLQHMLGQSGYNPGKEDGEFGARTEEALKTWQRDQGLKADGVYGKQSNSRLGLFEW